jgi:DNA-binding NarL/FixJ family response regulator
VAGGGTAFAPEVVSAISRAPDEPDPDHPLTRLTHRERTVLRLIGEGLSNRQIAGHLGLAEKTVKNYISRLLPKLGVERRTQAAILATRWRGRLIGDTSSPQRDPAARARSQAAGRSLRVG